MLARRAEPADTIVSRRDAAADVSGATGTVLHYRANMEFKLEMDPSMSGLALFWSVVQAKAPPALAPGNMALLGLLGLACAFRLDGSSTSRSL